MLIVEIKSKNRKVLDEGFVSSVVSFMGGTAVGKAVMSFIIEKMVDEIADHYEIPKDTLFYQALKKGIAQTEETDIDAFAQLLNPKTKMRACTTIGDNFIRAIVMIVAEELKAELAEFGIGKITGGGAGSKIGKGVVVGLDLAGSGFIRTMVETGAIKDMSNDMARAICDLDMAAMVKEQFAGSFKGLKGIGSSMAGFFGFEE